MEAFEEFRYKRAEGLWVITPYFNPCGYKRREFNYKVFARALERSGIPLLTIECAFGDQSFTLPESHDIVRVRSNSLLWQKERLMNLAISWLPKACTAVAWADCDLLFGNPNWAVDTMRLLEKVPVVQLFETCNRLPEENLANRAGGDVCRSFASVTPSDPSILNLGHFEKHGHTGYGWGATRELLERHGLYEYAIIGSADHYISHAAFGDFAGPCMKLMMDGDEPQLEHFRNWAEPFYRDVAGKVAAVPGEVLHLWHGDLKQRKYLLRNHQLTKYRFDPFTDLVARPGRPFEWAPGVHKEKSELVEMFAGYFASREEDGQSSKI
ncbi:MAG: hypothetical protein HY226_05630 [Candidatus Vogelbacteria bacterium]|nr:hypothetical protein [Candidatus Vogelbacteria bacterium]